MSWHPDTGVEPQNHRRCVSEFINNICVLTKQCPNLTSADFCLLSSDTSILMDPLVLLQGSKCSFVTDTKISDKFSYLNIILMCKYEHLVSNYDFKKAFQREITQNGLEWVCIFTEFFPLPVYFGDRKCVFHYDEHCCWFIRLRESKHPPGQQWSVFTVCRRSWVD